MSEKKIKDMLKEIQINIFCYGKLVFPKAFFNDLTDRERAEVVRRYKAGELEGKI